MFRRLYHVSLKIREEKLGYLPRPLDWVRPFGGITLFPVWPAFMMTTLKDVSPRAAAHVMSSSCDKDTSTRDQKLQELLQLRLYRKPSSLCRYMGEDLDKARLLRHALERASSCTPVKYADPMKVLV